VPDNVTVSSFALSEPDLNNYGLLREGSETYLAKGFQKRLNVKALSLSGQHNVENALAVCALAEALGLPESAVEKALTTFTGLKHRCELVREVRNVRYFNDSKATNVGSTLAAVNGLAAQSRKNIVLLLGGQSKGQNLAPLKTVLESTCKAIFAYGEDAQQFCELVPAAEKTSTMQEAFLRAQKITESGDVVLLSPACASFDQFKNFEARGDAFIALVEAL
jgi:UDP-N-acetylmuramoylalanine--D-glutamate ligase